eukprot:TRINITY_DN15434_c0_g2_i1.p1 TRINITY_DN15434_c0_g2~~TRINITY_DN15434_c0_g2_i1.p1  ORF type:complete len:470 (+),score=85.50 TRINITY_DN15434_c0_g2_i1:200-1609(+)
MWSTCNGLPGLIAILGSGIPYALSASLQDHLDDPFDRYLLDHERDYGREHAEYASRRALFFSRVTKIQAQNARTDSTWKAAINRFTDRTDEELSRLQGWRHMGRRESVESLLETSVAMVYPETLDWSNLTMAADVYDQAECGSCWAVATASVLEAHFEAHYKRRRTFSAQELVSCVPNPKHCGGSGGCGGATVELGLAWAMAKGLANLSETPYLGRDSNCAKDLNDDTINVLKDGEHQVLDADGRLEKLEATQVRFGRTFGLVGFRTLAINKLEPVMRALVEDGPVAVAVVADGWFQYQSGIFDQCTNSWNVNHAVVLFGYGQEGSAKYYRIRNSWGAQWGESGFIRVKRTDHEESECGVDHSPQDGVACEGGPSSVKVCGTCGILYDAVVPNFLQANLPHGSQSGGALGTNSKPTATTMRRKSGQDSMKQQIEVLAAGDSLSSSDGETDVEMSGSSRLLRRDRDGESP